MQDYLKGLNSNQLQAITSMSKLMLVLAGAGSGKTRVLTSKIKYLIDSGVPESNIVAFTFTNKAAREMNFRLRKLIGHDPLCSIGTFHSFCYNWILEFYYDLGFMSKPDVIDDDSKRKLINQITSDFNINHNIKLFIDNIAKIKNHVKVKGLNEEESLLVNKVYHEYQRRLLKANLVDFDDMIPYFLEIMKKREEIADMMKETSEYILIDEFQDTNQIQMELVYELAAYYGNIFAVGDDDQLIYSFRSSDINILNDFRDKANEVIVLNQNYRCTKEILKLANTLIDNNSDRTKKNLFSEIDGKVKVHYKEFNNTFEEARMVSKLIESIHNKGLDYKDIAILYRNNYQSYLLENEMVSMKIPYILYGGNKFLKYSEIRAIISLYRLIINPYDIISFNQLYNEPLTMFDALEYNSFIHNYNNQSKNIIDFLNSYANDKFQLLGIKLSDLCGKFKAYSRDLFFMEVLNVLGYNDYLKNTKEQDEKYSRIMTLKELICESNQDIKTLFNDLVMDNDDSISEDKVTLSTMHKAKGLEFKAVIIIGCNEGIIPPAKITKDEKDEERRLMYVAITRAMQILYITCANDHYVKGNKVHMNPSSFLIECGLFGNDNIDYFKKYWYNK